MMSRKIEKRASGSRVLRAIEEAMVPVSMNGTGGAEATFVFGPEFPGFDGHFPSGKVFPGVCQVQCVLALLARWQDSEVRLSEITSAKYMLPVFPDEQISCSITSLSDLGHGLYSLKAALLKGDQRVSDLRLKVRIR